MFLSISLHIYSSILVQSQSFWVFIKFSPFFWLKSQCYDDKVAPKLLYKLGLQKPLTISRQYNIYICIYICIYIYVCICIYIYIFNYNIYIYIRSLIYTISMVPVVLSPQMANSPHGPSPAAWAKCAGHSVLVVYSIGRRVDDARRLKPQNHPVLVVRPFKNHLKTMVRFRHYATPSSWNLGSKWHGNQLTIKNPFMDSTISLTHKRGSCLLKVSKKKGPRMIFRFRMAYFNYLKHVPYFIQWSLNSNFSNFLGSEESSSCRHLQYSRIRENLYRDLGSLVVRQMSAMLIHLWASFKCFTDPRFQGGKFQGGKTMASKLSPICT